jgi:hypothetical protein
MEVKPVVPATVSAIRAMLRNGIPAGREADFDNYYRKSALARFSDPKYLSGQPPKKSGRKTSETKLDVREELRRDLLIAKDTPSSHDRLVQLALEVLTQVAGGNYHPASRYNALLAIGDLNQAEQQTQAAPTPLPQARTILLRALDAPDQIDAVTVAALLGLNRHARLGISDTQQANLVRNKMLQVIAQKSHPTRSPEGHAWIRSIAIDTLAALSKSGNQAATVQTLLSIIADDKELLTTRAAVAEALGSVSFEGIPAAQAAPLVRGLAAMGVAICAAGLAEEHGGTPQPTAPVTAAPAAEGEDGAEGAATAAPTPAAASASGIGNAVPRQMLVVYFGAINDALKGTDEEHKGLASLSGGEGVSTLTGYVDWVLEKLNEPLDRAGVVNVLTAVQPRFQKLTGAPSTPPAAPSTPPATPAGPAVTAVP